MKRRDFFKGLFATGVVATIPLSVFSLDSENKIIEKVKKQQIDFNDDGCYLFQTDDKLLAYSKDYTSKLERNMLRSRDGGYLPGLSNWSVKIYDAEGSSIDALHKKLFEIEKLRVMFINNKIKFIGSAIMAGFSVTTDSKSLPINCNIELIGIGALEQISY